MGKEKSKKSKTPPTLEELSQLTAFSTIQETELNWLWYPYIPLGKVVILCGDPGVSKTTLALKLACMVSNGSKLPFMESNILQGKVVFENLEDNKSDTIKPRILKMGGNCDNIYYNSKDNKLKISDVKRLIHIVRTQQPTLFVLDPIQSFLEGKTNSNNVNEIRELLEPIVKIANRGNCTFLIVMHLNKSSDKKALYRALGSIDFMGVARSVLYLAEDPSEKGEILLENIKNNLAPKGNTIKYKITQDHGVEFLEDLGDITIEEITSMYNPDFIPKGKDLAKRFIKAELNYCLDITEGLPSKYLQDKAKMLGIAQATFDRAKKELCVDTYYNDENKEHYCRLNS